MGNFAYTEKSEFVNPRLTEHSKKMEQKLYKTGSNVYSAVGYGLEYPVMIEGTDGIIVIDPGETIENMEVIWKEFRKITQKPVKAVIISHNHGDHWGGMSLCVTEEESRSKDVLVIVDETFEKHFSQTSGELLDIRMGRAVWMYGSLLEKGEKGYINLGCGPVLAKGSAKFIRPNTTVPLDRPLKLTIAGVELELFHCEAETEDAVCVFLPKEKILFVGDAIQGEIFPNLYTIRGQVRDAKKWYKGIDLLRTYRPEFLVGTHMRPLHGEEECSRLLTDYRDAIQYTHDQAVRYINKGYTPDYALEELGTLPSHLYQKERLGEFYGTFKQGVRGVYDQYIGWFNGEAVKLNPLCPRETAPRYVRLMGGREKLMEQADLAMEEKDYPWAAELYTYLIRQDQGDMEARKKKAKALSQMAYGCENATWRNWYLTCAMGLMGGFDAIVEQVGPNGGFPPFSNSMKGLSTAAVFESLGVKVIGPKAEKEHCFFHATIEDTGEDFTLELRRGILEIHKGYVEVRDVITVSCKKEEWDQIVTKETTVTALVGEGKAVSNNMAEADRFFDYFEAFTPFVNMPFWLQ